MKEADSELYSFSAICHVCSKRFKARYNVAKRAKVCTPKEHLCKKGEKNGRALACTEGCCRSKYNRGVSSSMETSLDPRKVLSDEEFDSVISETRKIDDPYGVTLRFIAETGCRLGEAMLLRKGCFFWRDGMASIVEIPTLKRQGRPVRRVQLDNKSKVVQELKRWDASIKPDEVMFPVFRRTLQKALEDILEPIKPDRGSLVHIFRHTRASQLIAAGADWNFVRDQLGWKNLDMAKRYVHTSEKAVAEVFSRLRTPG